MPKTRLRYAAEISTNLRILETQIRGLVQMVDANVSPLDILDKSVVVRKGLDQIEGALIAQNVKAVLFTAVRSTRREGPDPIANRILSVLDVKDTNTRKQKRRGHNVQYTRRREMAGQTSEQGWGLGASVPVPESKQLGGGRQSRDALIDWSGHRPRSRVTGRYVRRLP